MVRILLVDDEPHLIWALQHSLTDEGYEVLSASDGAQAIALGQRFPPDLIILDIVMPRLNGHEVCQRLRRDPALAAVPILFLTALSAIDDRITGLDEGGDDYMIKPFNMRELKAHIRALLRRSQRYVNRGSEQENGRGSLVLGSLTLDMDTCRARANGETVQLTPAEFQLLHYLITHHGKVFSSQELLQEVWGYPPDTTEPSLVRWHIKNLRAKLEPDPEQPTFIHTIPHHGYILEEGWIQS